MAGRRRRRRRPRSKISEEGEIGYSLLIDARHGTVFTRGANRMNDQIFANRLPGTLLRGRELASRRKLKVN